MWDSQDRDYDNQQTLRRQSFTNQISQENLRNSGESENPNQI